MRIIVGLIVAVLVVVVAGPIVYYGTTDPCRMLAKDLADENYKNLANAVGVEPGKTPEAAEAMARMMTSQYSQRDCVLKLKDRWLGIE
ncbi:MAG: hypothetical protein K8R18_08225 [Parvibaculum sp.]|uniref:hypothetical protein n=1 Tax=Parvibaculum sp. TaxID=2024848 RepID=UPI0025DC16E0|nr:hypothetical protein [Parvibaculum sp.]MCE9649593.1 hypothetical protein [Parvibaculum sp.]